MTKQGTRFTLKTTSAHLGGYEDALVTKCPAFRPDAVGRAFEVEIKDLGVHFTSWTPNSSYDKANSSLRAHHAVRVMSKFRRPATLLDVGAGVGEVALPVLAMGQMHTVFAVEDIASKLEVLCRAAQLNAWLGNAGLQLMRAALSDGVEKVDLLSNNEIEASLVRELMTGKNGQFVHAFIGDDMLEARDLNPDVIRIVARGRSLYVLRGFRRYLESAEAGKVVVVAEADHELMRETRTQRESIYRLMIGELGYTAFCDGDVGVNQIGRLDIVGKELTELDFVAGGCADISYVKNRK